MPGMGPNPTPDYPTPDGPPPVSEEVAEMGGNGGPGPGPGPDGPGEMDDASGPALEQDDSKVSTGYYDEPAPAHESQFENEGQAPHDTLLDENQQNQIDNTQAPDSWHD